MTKVFYEYVDNKAQIYNLSAQCIDELRNIINSYSRPLSSITQEELEKYLKQLPDDEYLIENSRTTDWHYAHNFSTTENF